AYAIPSVFDDAEAAPLLCAGIIGYRALKLSEVEPGDRLGIYGFGASAHVTLQVARARGCEVFVCTREESHRALARRLGATWVGGIGEALPAKAHGAILFAPAGDLVPVALRNLARGGTLALAGIYMTAVPPLDYERDLFYERTVRSVTANTRADGAELLAEAARIPIRTAATTFPLEDANRALALLKPGGRDRDCPRGSGPLLLGHAHPAVVRAVERQMARGTSYFLLNEPAIELAEEIVKAVPCAEQVRYTSSGSEATFFALRVARAFRKREKIMKFEGGFHGTHDYALMSVVPRSPKAFPAPLMDSAGVPHLAAYGKVVAGGFPLACIAGPKPIMRHFDAALEGTADYVWQAGTFNGNAIACAAGLATLAELRKPGMYQRLFKTGTRLREGLAAAARKHGLA